MKLFAVLSIIVICGIFLIVYSLIYLFLYGFWFVLRQVSMCSPTAPELNSVDRAVLRDVPASTLSARFKGCTTTS